MPRYSSGYIKGSLRADFEFYNVVQFFYTGLVLFESFSFLKM